MVRRTMQNKRDIDPKMAKPTTPPPQFVPNKAQAMQVPQEEVQDNTQDVSQFSQMGMNVYGNKAINSGGKNKNKNKNNNKNNKNKNNNKNVKAVDPGAIYPCLYRYVYIWPRKRKENPYWMYVTYVGKRSVAGWRYDGRNWRYYSTSLREIESFYCY